MRDRDFMTDIEKQMYARAVRQDMKAGKMKGVKNSIEVPVLHNQLIFDSRFESGNLRKASKVNNVEYNLWLENDINTKGHTQWYYFKVVY